MSISEKSTAIKAVIFFYSKQQYDKLTIIYTSYIINTVDYFLCNRFYLHGFKEDVYVWLRSMESY